MTRSPFVMRHNVLVISHSGNDALAAASPYRLPWKTAYDVYDTNGPVAHGALTMAKADDWIYFVPSRAPYYLPALPLNLTRNGALNGVNLYVPRGATLVRTNFANTNSVPVPATLVNVGPLIIPGNNSRIVVNGTIITTNSSDAVFGWATYAVHSLSVGYRNAVATNALVEGNGTFRGSSDVLYLSDPGFYVSARNPVPVTIKNLTLVSDWDCGYFGGNTSVRTYDLKVYSSTNFDGNDCHGFVIGCRAFSDHGSTIAAMGSTLGPGGEDAALLAGVPSSAPGYQLISPVIGLLGTRLIEAGPGTNFTPFFVTNYLVRGWWSEYTLNPNHTAFNVHAYRALTVSSNFFLSTNVISSKIAPGRYAAGGPFTLNDLGNAYTDDEGQSWVSNYVAGDTNFWCVRTPAASGSVKYYATNGLFGTYYSTDTGISPSPIYAYSNSLSVGVMKIPLGPAHTHKLF